MSARWTCGIHVSLFAAATVVTAATHVFLESRYAGQRRELQAKAVSTQTHEIAAKWNSLGYTRENEHDIARAIDAGVDWNSLGLTHEQENSLRPRLAAVVAYLASPSFEEYYRLKTESLQFHFALDERLWNTVQEWDAMLPGDTRSDPRQVLALLWTKQSLRWSNSVAVPSRLVAVSPEHVRATLSLSNSHDAILRGNVAKGITMAAETLEPGFRYGGASEAGPFFHLSFFARSNCSTNAGPVYLSLAWSEVNRQWVMSRMITDRLLHMTLLF